MTESLWIPLEEIIAQVQLYLHNAASRLYNKESKQHHFEREFRTGNSWSRRLQRTLVVTVTAHYNIYMFIAS